MRDGTNATVYTGTVGADLGAWSTSFTHLYPLSFGTVSAGGTYTIVASGATSVPFLIGTAAALYAPLVHNSVDFYRAAGFDVAGIEEAINLSVRSFTCHFPMVGRHRWFAYNCGGIFAPGRTFFGPPAARKLGAEG